MELKIFSTAIRPLKKCCGIHNMEKVIIVGTGPAGLTAAIYMARANLKPVVVEGMQPGGQLTTTTDVENFPGFPEAIDGSTLVMKMREQAERFGARFVSGDVVNADFSGSAKKLILEDGKILESVTVVIASGARAMYLGLESETKLMGRGVSACATCDGALYRDVPVGVVGGGDTAAEEATYLAKLCRKVFMIHRRNELRASKAMQHKVLNTPNIEMVWDSAPEEVLGDDSGVTGVRVRHVKTGEFSDLSVTGLFVAIGHKPNTEIFIGQLGLDDMNYIATIPGTTQTSIDGIFACGDVQDHHYRQAVTAAGSGCMAAIEAERFLGT